MTFCHGNVIKVSVFRARPKTFLWFTIFRPPAAAGPRLAPSHRVLG